MNRIIPVFRTGTHTDSAGTARTFTADQLRAIADRFNADSGAVPIVKGHPASDDPAFGWVDRFLFEETSGTLYAVPKDVDAAFASEVRAGKYRRISLALHAPTSPSNPQPGMYYPKHIGYLGAATPAVTGLKAANFATEEILMFDFNDDAQVSKFSEVLGRTLIKLGFKPPADPGTPPPAPDVDVTKSAEYQESEAKRIALEEKLATTEAAHQKLAAEQQRAECAAFAEKLADAGKLTPVEATNLAHVLFAMCALDGELTFTAGEGDKATEVKGKPAELLRGIFEKLPKRIEFGELSGQGDDGLTEIGFTAPDQRPVSAAKMDLHRRALAYAAHHKCDYLEAVSTIESGALQ